MSINCPNSNSQRISKLNYGKKPAASLAWRQALFSAVALMWLTQD